MGIQRKCPAMAVASERLAALGYTQVDDFGGILNWPYDTETGAFVP